MKKRNVIKKVAILLLIVSMIVPKINESVKAESVLEQTKKEYIVFSKSDLQYDKVNKRYTTDKSEYTEYMRTVNISINTMSETQAKKLRNNSDVVCVEENFKLTGCGKNDINPKKISKDWNIKMINADINQYPKKMQKKVKNYEKKAEESDDKVKIAIIDSGVDETGDIEIKERCNLVPGDEEISPCFEDNTGHGTSIAGVIGRIKDSYTNVSGIDTNSEIYSIKVMDSDNTAPVSRIIEGIYRAIEYDVDIINMSFGTTYNSYTLHRAIMDAHKAGIILVAAAGNRGYEEGMVEYPAAYDEVIAVGSVDARAELAEESSKGEGVDVLAPGELVRTLTNFGLETASSGTSIAAPHISAMAAILWERDRSKSADFIRGLIECSANEIQDDGITYGIADLGYAQEIYDKYASNYEGKTCEIEKNTNEIVIDEKAVKIAGRWSKNNHEVLVTNANGGILTTKQLNLVKVGIRYNDAIIGTSDERDIWHSLNSDTNYMVATYYVGKVIQDEDLKPGNISRPNGMTYNQYLQMKSDINILKSSDGWDNAMEIKGLSYSYSKDNARFVLFGMSLHIITDAFAHRAWVKTTSGDRWSGWFQVGTQPAGGGTKDDINTVSSRYKAAGQVVKNAFNSALKPSNIKQSYTIRSKQIMENNTYFDGSFALKQLMFMAKENKVNDNTYANWYKKMALYTYTSITSEQQELDAIEY